jgi:hypothetical protein
MSRLSFVKSLFRFRFNETKELVSLYQLVCLCVMGEWLSKSNVVIFGLFVVVCLLVAERPQLNARRCPTDVQEGKSGSVLVDVDTMREKRDEQNKEEITKKEEYKKEEYKQGVSDRQSEHVQNFLKNAAALPSNVVPTEPFVDDTSNARPVLSQVDDRLFVGSQWAAIALSEGINVGSLNITGILNVAFDLDVDFVDEAHFVGAAQKSNRRHKLQLAKVGLVRKLSSCIWLFLRKKKKKQQTKIGGWVWKSYRNSRCCCFGSAPIVRLRKIFL